MDHSRKIGAAEMFFPFTVVSDMDPFVYRAAICTAHFAHQCKTGKYIHIHFAG